MLSNKPILNEQVRQRALHRIALTRVIGQFGSSCIRWVRLNICKQKLEKKEELGACKVPARHFCAPILYYETALHSFFACLHGKSHTTRSKRIKIRGACIPSATQLFLSNHVACKEEQPLHDAGHSRKCEAAAAQAGAGEEPPSCADLASLPVGSHFGCSCQYAHWYLQHACWVHLSKARQSFSRFEGFPLWTESTESWTAF